MPNLWRFLTPVLFAATLVASVPEFEPNLGQADSRYPYLARISHSKVWVEDHGLALAEVRLQWLGVSGGQGWTPLAPTGNTFRYCNQPNRQLCAQSVPGYARLLRKDLYPGIDWVIYGRDQRLEYDLVVHAGARLEHVRLRVTGAAARLDEQGRLHAGPVLHWRPDAYQTIQGKRVPVAAELRPLGGHEFALITGAWRPDLDLVIDPVIESGAVIGGQDEDEVLGTFDGCRYGTTRSGDWSRNSGTGRDVFVEFNRNQYGMRTLFWGGDADEQIGGADYEIHNAILTLAGWTASRNIPAVSSYWEQARGYAGGATDGFILRVHYGWLEFASYFGGPGADRLYDVRALDSTYMNYAVAGETDDPDWPGAVFQRIGSGGKVDAVAGMLQNVGSRLLVIGGSGDDRAMRLRAAGQDTWVVGGETDSADFPAQDRSPEAGKRDLWLGRVRFNLLDAPLVRVFGGSGNERFGGMAWIAGEGIYLAGATESANLPGVSGDYHGGASDGFLAQFDPQTGAPRVVTYLGGSGADEISTMETRDGDLFLGGATDSRDLTLPGLAVGEGVAGGLDGLFIWCNAFAEPVRAVRLGGAEDDRVLGIEPVELGKVTLSGSSRSGEWLQKLDPLHSAAGGGDGFTATVRFSAVHVKPTTTYLGRDLMDFFPIRAVSERPGDGILLVRSTDPSKLLVSPVYNVPGADRILLHDVDLNSGAISVGLQALSDSGEVDILLEGRTPESFPLRRLRVRLAPSAISFVPPVELQSQIKFNFRARVMQSTVLPDGTLGPALRERPGIAAAVTLQSSDPEGLPLADEGNMRPSGDGTFWIDLMARREGVYTLTPVATHIPLVVGGPLKVRSVASVARVFPTHGPFQLPKDHVTTFSLEGRPGDTLRFSSTDPGRLRVWANGDAMPADSVTVFFTTSVTRQSVTVLAVDGEGSATVRAEGTLLGDPIDDSLTLGLAPYTTTISGAFGIVPVGSQVNLSVETKSNGNPGTLAIALSPALTGLLQLRSSDPCVFELVAHQADSQSFTFKARKTGSATVDIAAPNVPEFAQVRVQIQVAAASIDFGTPQIVIPAGAGATLIPKSSVLNANALKAVRLRLNVGAPLSLRLNMTNGPEVTVDYYSGYAATLSAENAQPGQQATLYVSAPGMDEISVPIRVVEAVLMPVTREIQVAPSLYQEYVSGEVSYEVWGYEGGRAFPASPAAASTQKSMTLQPVFTPAGICETKEPMRVGAGFTSIALSYQCPGVGETILSLPSVPGLHSSQPQYTVRIISQPKTVTRPAVPSRLLIGNRLQVELSGWAGDRITITRVTSSDPDRVRLSLDPKAIGSGEVSIAPKQPRTIYVQGFASEGAASLAVETSNGWKDAIPVYLFGSSLAVRPDSGYNMVLDQSATLSLDHPRAQNELKLEVVPQLVDVNTGKLLWVQGLAIRGATDPFYAQAESSDPAVLQPIPPDGILNETDGRTTFKCRVNGNGEALVRVAQPEGFTLVPDAALRVRVFARHLKVNLPSLAANLQVPILVESGESMPGNVTLTSLDPEKLVVSTMETALGQTSVTVPLRQTVYLQAMDGALPGQTARIRMEAPGYITTERQVAFVAAELQPVYEGRQPEFQASDEAKRLELIYGTIDTRGRVEFNGSMRPGVNINVRASSSDPGVIEVTKAEAPLGRYVVIPLRTVRPGSAEILVEAPPEIVNRAARIPLVVGRFQFNGTSAGTAARYLVSKFSFRNPRSVDVPVTVTSVGKAAVRLGTAASGAGAPSGETVTVQVGAGREQAVFFEPVGAEGSAAIRLSAPDFADNDVYIYFNQPQVLADPPGPLSLSLASGSATLAFRLSPETSAGYPELPLGTGFGKLALTLESSNSQVVKVPATPVEIQPGQSRASTTLQLVGRGDAVVSVIYPAGFNSTVSRRDLLITVR